MHFFYLEMSLLIDLAFTNLFSYEALRNFFLLLSSPWISPRSDNGGKKSNKLWVYWVFFIKLFSYLTLSVLGDIYDHHSVDAYMEQNSRYFICLVNSAICEHLILLSIVSLYKSISLSVSVFGCSLPPPKRRTPASWNFEGWFLLG